MHYLILFLLFFTFPAKAEFAFSSEPSKAKHMVVAGNSVIDDKNVEEKEEFKITDDLTDADKTIIPSEPKKPVAPTQPTATTRKVLKKIPLAKAERSISDDRIDDSYVQKLIRDNFNFTHKID